MKKSLFFASVSIIMLSACGSTPPSNSVSSGNVQTTTQTGFTAAKNTTKTDTKKSTQNIKKQTVTKKPQPKPAPRKNKKLILHKDGNVFLQEPGRNDEVLTTKAHKKCTSSNSDDMEYEITYKIIKDTWPIGLVQKMKYPCEADTSSLHYYIIDLSKKTTSNTHLIGINKEAMWFSVSHHGRATVSPSATFTIKDTQLIISVPASKIAQNLEDLDEDSDNDGYTDTWDHVTKEMILEDGYRLSWNHYIKKIDLAPLLWSKTASTPRKSSKPPILRKDYPIALNQEAYQLNRLWDIKEYYHLESYSWWWEHHTVYLKGSKALDVKVTFAKNGTYNALIHTEDTIKQVKEYNDNFDKGFFFRNINAMQPIFDADYVDKLIVDKNLDTVSIVSRATGKHRVIRRRK